MGRARQGFTLIEMMIVVGIIALAMALAFQNMTQSRDRANVEGGVRLLRAKIEHARTLSTQYGSRVGYQGNLWAYNNCPVQASTNPGWLWVSVDAAGNWIVPHDVSLAGSTITVNCESGTIQPDPNTPVAVQANVAFAFSGTGRLAPGGSTNVLVAAKTGRTDNLGRAIHEPWYGFRVLPSGLVCTASPPPGASLCDHDT